ncbi:MAG: hypothetical protein WD894_21670 [Pirellulales bacterium]
MNTLRTETQTALEQLASDQSYPHRLQCETAGQRLQAEIVALDTLACAFNYLGVELDSLATAPVALLKQVADRLSHRLTYLLEPITAVEVDANQCAVQLRSNPPQKDDNGTSYYELLVKRGGLISLSRFKKEPREVRCLVPAHVTREVFLRLVDDFSKAAV